MYPNEHNGTKMFNSAVPQPVGYGTECASNTGVH
jgi:hypothetical protein